MKRAVAEIVALSNSVQECAIRSETLCYYTFMSFASIVCRHENLDEYLYLAAQRRLTSAEPLSVRGTVLEMLLRLVWRAIREDRVFDCSLEEGNNAKRPGAP